MTNNVYIRTDGDQCIGLGHLVRCIALAHMLKPSFNVVFVCKSIPVETIEELFANRFSLIRINTEGEFLKNLRIRDIVVLDGYHFDTNYQQRIKKLRCKLVCIDDLHEAQFVADLIINHVPGLTPNDYKAAPYTKFALGLEYALLRSRFLMQSQKPVIVHKHISTLFICFGGSDPKNITEHTLKILRSFNNFTKIIVVTGAAYSHLNSLQEQIKQDKRVDHYHAVNEEGMLTILEQIHLAIVPASGILFEVLTFNIPVITGWYVDNQSIFITEMIKFKQVINAKDFSQTYLIKALQNVLDHDVSYDKVFDGYSGKRINTLFNKLANE